MIATLILGFWSVQVAAPASASGQELPAIRPLMATFQRIIGRPTGQNGYEEFVRAGDLSTSEELQKINIFQLWLATDRKTPPPVLVPGLNADSSMLDVKRAKLKAAMEIRMLVGQGCQKLVNRPGEIKIDSLFPEFAQFKAVAKLLIDCADAEVANGRPDEAAKILRDTYHMGVLISDGILISALVGTAIRSIALLGVQRNSWQFSESGWKELERFGGQHLSAPPPEFLAYTKEQAYMLSAAKDLLYRNKAFDIKELGTQMDWPNTIRTLPTQKKEQMLQRAEGILASMYKPYLDRGRRPEAEWLLPFEEAREVELPANASPEQQFFGFLQSAAGFGGVLEIAARSRTQLRLLVLTARVNRFRFHYDRLPNGLKEAVGDSAIDPLTNQPFIFEKHTAQTFRIASKGSKKLGEIDLVYRRPQGGSDSDGPIPPTEYRK